MSTNVPLPFWMQIVSFPVFMRQTVWHTDIKLLDFGQNCQIRNTHRIFNWILYPKQKKIKYQFIINVSNRKIIQGLLSDIKINEEQETKVIRAIDKLDKPGFGLKGVEDLLRKERKDNSGAITKGADLNDEQVDQILKYLIIKDLKELKQSLKNPLSQEGIKELEEFFKNDPDFAIVGHILDRKERFYELHQQTFIVNINWWKQRKKPFVGEAGKLLDKILLAVDLSRTKDTFIVNILKCKPPKNRDPLRSEIEKYIPYLNRQIKIIQPKLILALGKVAGKSLIGREMSLQEMRGKIFDYNGIPLSITYHPEILLRNPNLKKLIPRLIPSGFFPDDEELLQEVMNL